MGDDERIRVLEEQVATLSESVETLMTAIERLRPLAERLRDATRIIVTLKALLIDKGVLTDEEFDAKCRELGVAIDEIKRLEDMFRSGEHVMAATGDIDAVNLIFRALCDQFKTEGDAASMTRAQLRLRTGLDDATLGAALRELRGPRNDQDLRVTFHGGDPDRIMLGSSWRGRCQDDRQP